MKKALSLAVWAALMVFLASGASLAQSATPEHPLYKYVNKWDVDGAKGGMAVDSGGNVYALTHDGVVKFAADGAFLTRWDAPCSERLTVDSGDNVYVTNSCSSAVLTHKVQKFDSNGNLLDSWGTQGNGDGQFRVAGGIAVDPRGSVYVSDFPDDPFGARVQKFDPNGSFLEERYFPADEWGNYDSFIDLATDSRGNLYAADDDGVFKFAPDGTLIDTVGGAELCGFGLYGGIATDPEDNLYVVDDDGNCFRKYTPDGEFVTGLQAGGKDDGKFNGLIDVAIGAQGHVYVVERWNQRIQAFEVVEDNVPPDSQMPLGVEKLPVNRGNVTLDIEPVDQGVGTKEITYEATGAQQISRTTVQGTQKYVEISSEGATTVTYSAVDRAGNVEQAPKRTIVTIDKTPPRVRTTRPRHRATDVGREASIEANLSEAVFPYTVKANAFRIYESRSNTPLPATVSYDAATRRATLDPRDPLKAGARYRVVVNGLVSDLAGNALDQDPNAEGTQVKTWRFTVTG